MKRPHGTGTLYVKWGSYYGRWIAPNGRRANRKIGKARLRGEEGGLTRREAERGLRRLIEAESLRPAVAIEDRARSVDDVANELRVRLAIEGARLSYRQNCESMQRVHISPAFGKRRVQTVTRQDVEHLAGSMLGRGLAPKTVRNVMTFLHAVFALALANEWIERNPVSNAARPKRRRQGDANPDLQFLTVEQLDLVLAAIPDEVVTASPGPTRRGRAGPAPPPPPDVLGPVLRVLILAAALTGLRQSELIGLRWKDVDFTSRRIRVRNAVVRGQHSGEGKSDLSTRRSVPMTERLREALQRWRERTVFHDDAELVFAHPQLGTPLDRTKVTRRFQGACRRAGVPVIRFHEPPTHLRDAARGVRRTATGRAGVPRPRRSEDDADLRPLRPQRLGTGHGRCCVRSGRTQQERRVKLERPGCCISSEGVASGGSHRRSEAFGLVGSGSAVVLCTAWARVELASRRTVGSPRSGRQVPRIRASDGGGARLHVVERPHACPGKGILGRAHAVHLCWALTEAIARWMTAGRGAHQPH
jgi:integrase